MKKVILLMMYISLPLWAHEEHQHHHQDHDEMESAKAQTGMSLYQFDSKWIDKNGKEFELKSLKGEPRIVSMLYTRCLTACPLLVNEVSEVIKKLPEAKKNISVTLFSFDSEKETPETMKDFLKKRNLPENWQVFKSDSSTVAELAAALGVRYKKLKSGEYIHSNAIYLLNEKGEVIAQKEGLNTSNAEFVKAITKTR
ncbi:SCO family protein [Bdellovibrio reynosensis]|uniref:SCO family protein n=1 Tax=Bdellovibrio reynosensis TaxID=2835041 RepID=A0ABY4C9B5_9BACT|nr:SCO family protein [Bdellovibrio reynosensis]UOF01535.1 SCO family protein [Bdellovibrio reynosensis]